MTKEQLKAEIESNPIFKIVDEKVMSEPKSGGDLWYGVEVREVVDGVGKFRWIEYYVANAGTPEEFAYYKDARPVREIKTKEEHDAEQEFIIAQKTKAMTDVGVTIKKKV